MQTYLPIVGFVLITMALLFATAADRKQQWHDMVAAGTRMLNGVRAQRFSARRVLFWLVVVYLVSYVWTYQRIQDALANQLTANDIEEIKVGSLIIPWSAFFQSAYHADAGFSKSKTRTRTNVSIRGHLWSGFEVEIDEQGMANINKIAGKTFVFSYLTDVKILRPVIETHMQQLVHSKQIDAYEIETFDNRGPYILVALNQKNRDKDTTTIATSLATGLHTNLTQTNQLKVNQVVIKIVDPDPYITNKTIKIIGRGNAGNY